MIIKLPLQFSKLTNCLLSVAFLFCSFMTYAQSEDGTTYSELAGQINPITTAVPFLIIAPDSRAGGMGDAGVATTPDANSMHWNPSKYAFIDKELGASLTYTPWLRELIPDVNLMYLSGYYKANRNSAYAMSLLYFSLGQISFTDNRGNSLGNYKPNEFALDFAYAMRLGENTSGAISLRYIRSDLTGGGGGYSSTVGETHAGQAVAVDVSFYYNKKIILAEKRTLLGLGANISNLGSKISYTELSDMKDFIPMNMRLGGSLDFELNKYNNLMVTADINKLLVPTTPEYGGANGDSIIAGMDPDVSVAQAVFQSFRDAPGGFSEELHEYNASTGLEYLYMQQFALRAGYFYEHVTKGDRKFFSAGFGLKLNALTIDFSYLIPYKSNHPLRNTLRFSLTYEMGSGK